MNLCEMKSSGVDWIGDIPLYWNILKGKYCLSLLQRPILESDEVITCFRDGVVTLRSCRREEGFTVSLKEIGYQGIEPGDIVVHGMDGFAGAIGISDSRGKASPVLIVLDTNLCKKFVVYYLRVMAFTDVFLAQSTGIRIRSCDTSWNKLKNLPYPIPPKNEQIAIANFLDSKCAEIDALCADIEKQIETLQEYKKSVITEAVTKGLDPNVEMKNSGVEWIGLIPKHWGTLSLQYLLSFSGSGTTPKGLDKLFCEDGNGINWLNTGDLTDSYIENIPQKLKSEVMPQYSALRLYPSGSLVIAMYGATAGKLGILLEPSTTNQACCVLVPNKDLLNLKYLFYQLLAARSSLVSLSKGGGQPNISQETVRKFKVCFTELQEQSNIVNFLDEKCNIIDGAIEIKKSQLDTLAQYKQSLIYEYVTGKKAVPANF